MTPDIQLSWFLWLCLRGHPSMGPPPDRTPGSCWLNVFLASPWSVIKMNSADCRCLLERLLISLGQAGRSERSCFFPYLCVFVDLFLLLFFLIFCVGAQHLFSLFAQFQYSRGGAACIILSALHSSTNSRFRCQKTHTIYLCDLQSLCGTAIFCMCIDELCNHTFFLLSFHLDYISLINIHHVFFFEHLAAGSKRLRLMRDGWSFFGWLTS